MRLRSSIVMSWVSPVESPWLLHIACDFSALLTQSAGDFPRHFGAYQWAAGWWAFYECTSQRPHVALTQGIVGDQVETVYRFYRLLISRNVCLFYPLLPTVGSCIIWHYVGPKRELELELWKNRLEVEPVQRLTGLKQRLPAYWSPGVVNRTYLYQPVSQQPNNNNTAGWLAGNGNSTTNKQIRQPPLTPSAMQMCCGNYEPPMRPTSPSPFPPKNADTVWLSCMLSISLFLVPLYPLGLGSLRFAKWFVANIQQYYIWSIT